jgi:hypothetical protein
MEEQNKQQVVLIEGRPYVFVVQKTNPFDVKSVDGTNELLLDDPSLRILAKVTVLDQDITELSQK